jgi:cytochrome c-type biogenesis protein CcmI
VSVGITVGTLLFVLAIVLYILHPLLTGAAARLSEDAVHLTNAEARKRVALRALRDVEYDYHTGKLDDSDYQELKTELTAEAIDALEAADTAEAGESSTDQAAAASDVEREIARIREGLRSGSACDRCGHLNPPGSKFCARCGASLVARAAS